MTSWDIRVAEIRPKMMVLHSGIHMRAAERERD